MRSLGLGCLLFGITAGYQIDQGGNLAFAPVLSGLTSSFKPGHVQIRPELRARAAVNLRRLSRIQMTTGQTENQTVMEITNTTTASAPSIFGTRRDLLVATTLALLAANSLTLVSEFLSQTDREAPLEIQYVAKVDDEFLKKRGVRQWSVWESTSVPTTKFDYVYDKTEAVYILEGEALVTPKDGRKPVRLVPGVFATFPKGLPCTWEVKSTVKKFYKEYDAIDGFE